jgi:hypothetical protein
MKMTRQEIASLACKVLAVWVFVHVALTAGKFALLVVDMLMSIADDSVWGYQIRTLCLTSLLLLFYLLLAWMLWRKSDRLAVSMVCSDETPVVGSDITKSEWLSIAFVTLGGFLLVTAMRDLTQLLASLWIVSERVGRLAVDEVIGTGVQLALALWLMLGSRGLARSMWRFRTAGLKGSADAQEEQPTDPDEN